MGGLTLLVLHKRLIWQPFRSQLTMVSLCNITKQQLDDG